MRILFRALIGLAVLCVMVAAIGFCWLYLYSGDIPCLAHLSDFAPANLTTAAYDCAATSVTVIPYSRLGQNVESATTAAEGDYRVLSLRIAPRLFCKYKNQVQSLQRQLLEYKISIQIRRRFTSEQILAMYLNGQYFDDGVWGVEAASEYYYGKPSSELDVAQAAMLAGLLRHPSLYSPKHHPDKARVRRDAVIATMVSKGAITSAQGQAATQRDVR